MRDDGFFDALPALQVVIMGVSGSGKSTVGALLAQRLEVEYADADDFHSAGNRAKLTAGKPLSDEDRQPWLNAIGEWLAKHADGGVGGVATCSALKRRYRDTLRRWAPDLVLVYCEGSRQVIGERMATRSHHFMPAALLDSQFAELEAPSDDEDPITADVTQSPEGIVDHVIEAVRRRVGRSGTDVRESAAESAAPAGYSPGLDAEELAFQRLYGPWEHWSPAEVADVFGPLGIDWWIAGGYAIEAFTGVRRPHEDIDVSIFRRDLGPLRQGLGARFHIWSAGSGMLRPLNDQYSTPHRDSDQVWLREHALAPWRADVLLNPDRDGAWVNRRDTDFAAPLSEVTWSKADIRYLRPEIALAFKAKLARPKDDLDFDAAVPLLNPLARAWLADFLARREPNSPWCRRLRMD